MPRLNYGTLLENIVVLEVMRLCFDHSTPDEATAFATAFAMPPLTQCWANSQKEQVLNPAFTNAWFVQLAAGLNSPQSLQEYWSLCRNNTPALPVCRLRAAQPDNLLNNTGGPNGALLAAMLAAQRSREIHIWANDDGGRYGEIPPALPNSLSEVPNTAAHAAALVGAHVNGTATHDPGSFPDTIRSLQTWLAQGPANTATLRVGFLDPDNYTEGQTQVQRDQHQNWLRVLAACCERTLSVMFASCQNRGTKNSERNRRLAWFHQDEVGDYPSSLVFEYRNSQTGVKVRWSADQIGQITAELRRRVENAWRAWNRRFGTLTVHENGQPAR